MFLLVSNHSKLRMFNFCFSYVKMSLCIHGGAAAPPFFCSSPGCMRMDPTAFFLQDPSYSPFDKHCIHLLSFLSSTQTEKSECSSGFVWFVTCSFLSKHTSSPMLLVHLPAQTGSRCNSWRGHRWRWLLGKLLLTSWKDERKVPVRGTLPLCHLLPSKNFLDVLSMEHQHHEAAGNNGRKPNRGWVGRYKQVKANKWNP